jgi:hypothetical protein
VNAWTEALRTGFAATAVMVLGVMLLAALEARLLDPRRGVLGAFARMVRLLLQPPPALADHPLGVAAAVLAVSVPVAAAALVLGHAGTVPVASGLLCLSAAGPLLSAVAAGVDERARLGLYDALVGTTRRLLTLLACALAAPARAPCVAVAAIAVILLVRSRHRGDATLLPRWEHGLAGRFLVLQRIGERSTVVAVAAVAGVAVQEGLPALVAVPSVVVVVAAGAAFSVVGVVGAWRLGPLSGEGLAGPAWLIALAAALRVFDPGVRF